MVYISFASGMWHMLYLVCSVVNGIVYDIWGLIYSSVWYDTLNTILKNRS